MKQNHISITILMRNIKFTNISKGILPIAFTALTTFTLTACGDGEKSGNSASKSGTPTQSATATPEEAEPPFEAGPAIGTVIGKPMKHPGEATYLRFTPDGSKLISSSSKESVFPSYNRTLCVWDVKTGKNLATINLPQTISFTDISPDGTKIATSSYDNFVRLWDTATGKELAKMQLRNGIYQMQFSPDGSKLMAIGYKTVQVIDVNQAKELPQVNLPTEITNMAISPADSSIMTTYGKDYSIHVLDSTTGKELFNIPQANINSYAFNKDGSKIVAHDTSNKVYIFDVKTKKTLCSFKESTPNIFSTRFSAGGSKILTNAGWMIRIHDAQTGKSLSNISSQVSFIAESYSPAFTVVATGDREKNITIWNGKTGDPLHEISSVEHRALVLSPDGSKLAYATAKGEIHIIQTR